MPELTKKTIKNLKRVDLSIEKSFNICKCCGNPLPSWIEISPIDFCTRICKFCPKGTEISPNQKHLFLHEKLALKIAQDLKAIDFKGVLMLAGYGEPLASPSIMNIIKIFSEVCRVEMATNGDLLTEEKIVQLIKNGLSYIIVSVYKGPEQYSKLDNIFKNSGIKKSNYTLRDRWYDSDKDFGIKLTNRAGIISIGNQPPIDKTKSCFYPHYSMMIDWNGDVLLCTQDWHRRIKCGNLAFDSLHDIWIGPVYTRYRDLLFKGNRKIFPCSTCNCDGTLHGKTHALTWHGNK